MLKYIFIFYIIHAHWVTLGSGSYLVPDIRLKVAGIDAFSHIHFSIFSYRIGMLVFDKDEFKFLSWSPMPNYKVIIHLLLDYLYTYATGFADRTAPKFALHRPNSGAAIKGPNGAHQRLLQRQINWFAPSLYFFFNSKRGERLSTHTSLERVLRHSSLMSARRRKLPCDHLNTPPLRKRPLLTTP